MAVKVNHKRYARRPADLKRFYAGMSILGKQHLNPVLLQKPYCLLFAYLVHGPERQAPGGVDEATGG